MATTSRANATQSAVVNAFQQAGLLAPKKDDANGPFGAAVNSIGKKERNNKRDNAAKKDTLVSVEQKRTAKDAFRAAKAVADAGALIGAYSVEHDIGQQECISAIELLLREHMLVLTEEMFSRKHEVGMLYINNINEARNDAGLPDLAMGSQYNYMSRTKAFIAARGAEPLDLFGNIAAAKQAAERALTGGKKTGARPPSGKAADKKESVPESNVEQGNLAGVEPLLHFMNEWLAVNKGVPALEMISKHASEFALIVGNIAKAQGVKV